MPSTTVTIPDELRARIRARIAGTEFDSVEEYVLFVLSEVVEGEDFREDEGAGPGEDVEGRLEELGYL